MKFRLKYLLLAAAAIFSRPGFAQEAGGPSHCERQVFGKASYIICTVEPTASGPIAGQDGKAGLKLFWKDGSGEAYRSFGKVRDAVQADGGKLVFAMNAGMYSDDFVPVGLYVENGRELVAVNTKEMKGKPAAIPNFYKKPNGIFLLDDEGASILTTEAYLRRVTDGAKQPPHFATQSGPMLVINGKLHPALIEGSTDSTRRSGVGVCGEGTVRFAISEDEVNFYDFALLFRDGLKCDNALFLDGGHGTGFFDPAMKRADWSWHGGYGPIFGLVE